MIGFNKWLITFKSRKARATTIQTMVKNFKKYLHIANDKGIVTNLNYKNIQSIHVSSNRAF
jgi:uncharacterized protein (UPF0218 family)